MPARGPDYVLNAVRNFIATIQWAPDEYLDAMTLILAVTHVKDLFATVPYVLVTSDKPKVGKTTLSKNIPLLLADRTWQVGRNTTSQALRDKFLDREPPVSVIFDDIGKIFGGSGRQGLTNPVYDLAVKGYENTGTISVSRNGSSVDAPAFIIAFMNGLGNAVPEDLATRCIQFKLKPKPARIRMRNALSASVKKDAESLKLNLHRWASGQRGKIREYMKNDVLYVHPLLTDRVMQLWGPLFAVADAAGGTWPQRCLAAFLSMALDEDSRPPVLAEDQLLLDSAKVILAHNPATLIFTADLVAQLRAMPGGDYEDYDNDHMIDLLDRALPEPMRSLRGRTLDNRTAVGMGYMTAPVLRAAAELHDELNPPAEERGPSRAQQALTLTEVKR
jgi:hypothetical protein